MKMNHVGLMVGDMDKAVEFYTKALGLKIVMGNTKVKEERETAIGRMCVAVFGEGFKGFNIAHLVTTDGIGVEMFEMKERQERHEVDFTRLGIFHFCLQTDDFEGAIARTEQYGGKVRMDIMRYHPEDESKQAKMVYLEDPFGNLFELYSHSYEETYASDYEYVQPRRGKTGPERAISTHKYEITPWRGITGTPVSGVHHTCAPPARPRGEY